MTLRTAILPLLVVLVAGFASAQEPTAFPLPDRTPIRALQHDDAAVQLWATGRTYKASFHDGMTFLPYLGADYPHNQPFGWTTTSVRVGERDLLVPGVAPQLRHGGFRAEYDFGAVVEAYDVLAEGLEQTFVLAQRPPAAGDLVIRGRVRTGLAAPEAAPAAHRDLVFRDDRGLPIVGYGAATAIDDKGARFAMTTRCTGDEIELRLDAAAVAAAHFPLVVDPLVTRALTSTIGMVCAAIDCDNAVAEGAATQKVLEAFAYRVSGTDSDIWVYATGVAFNGSAFVFADNSTEESTNVSCAYVAGTHRWVMAWQALDAFGTQRIRAHVHTVDDTTQGSVTRSILNVSGVHDWRPDVGGTLGGSTTDALIVFQRENTGATFADTATSTVMGNLFDTSSTNGSFRGVFQISSTGNFDSERPSVNQQAEGGPAGVWMAVAQVYNNAISGDDWDLIGYKVGATGTVLAGNWYSDLAAASPARHQLAPIVEGHGGRYAVVFSTVETAVGKTTIALGRDLWIECFDWAAAASSPSAAGNFAPVNLLSNSSRVVFATGLAFDAHTRSHWAPVCRTVAPFGEAVWVGRCVHDGTKVEGMVSAFGAATGAVVSDIGAAFDRADGRFRLHYVTSDAVNTKVWGQFLAHPATAASNAGTGCSAATINLSGPAAAPFEHKNALIGTRGAVVEVASTHANDLHFLIAGFAMTSQVIVHPLVAPGCTQLVSTSEIGVLPLQIGAQPTWPLNLPLSMTGITLMFQDWIYDPAANQLTATDRLMVLFAR